MVYAARVLPVISAAGRTASLLLEIAGLVFRLFVRKLFAAHSVLQFEKQFRKTSKSQKPDHPFELI